MAFPDATKEEKGKDLYPDSQEKKEKEEEMIYRVFKGYDTGEEPIWEWHCDCEKCLTTGGQCSEVMQANFEELYRGVKRVMNLFGKNEPLIRRAV